MKRWLYLTHRWLGLFGCLLIVLWFVSGFVMMYVPFPALTDSERLQALPVIDVARIRLAPTHALAAVHANQIDERTDEWADEQIGEQVDKPTEKVLQMRLLQPVDTPLYALRTASRGWIGVDAQSGRPLRIDAAAARQSAERFAQQPAVATELIERDQWSVSSSLDPHRPLFAVQMADGGLHYVSSRTGEVVRDTQRIERGWSWVGAVVHWVYPTVLRREAAVWHWTVIALSSYALLTAVLGTFIGVLRFKRYASGKRSPYAGWMRWHHLLGLGSAGFVLAWLLSGLLSMNPFDVFAPRRLPAAQLQAWGGERWAPTLPARSESAKEVEWLADPAGTLAWVRRDAHVSGLWREAQRVAIDAGFINERVAALNLGPAQHIERLDALDLHYHARNAPRRLPVWRARFADTQQTWVHFDGQTGQPFGRVDASNRAGRWLYHGLHSWDFEPLLQRRPLWDVLMLAAMALGTAFSITSVVIGWRRLQIHRRRPSPLHTHRPLPTPANASFN